MAFFNEVAFNDRPRAGLAAGQDRSPARRSSVRNIEDNDETVQRFFITLEQKYATAAVELFG